MKLKNLVTLMAIYFFSAPLLANQFNPCLATINAHVDEDWLILNSCNLTNEDMPKVSVFLKNHPEIHALFLDGNYDLSAKGYEALADNKITTLSIEDVGDVGNVELLALAKNASYQHLNLSKNSIGDFKVESGWEALANLPNLQTLHLSENGINDAQFVKIANSLVNNKSLSYLNVSGNKISLKGAKSLAAWRHLFAVDLSNNLLRDEGAIEIANSTISYVNLSKNGIGDKGAAAFAKNWKPLGTIHPTLFLAENNITNEGAFALANNQIPYYFSLNLSYNPINKEGKQALEQTKNIDLNFWGDDEGEARKSYLKQHSLTVKTPFENNSHIKQRTHIK